MFAVKEEVTLQQEAQKGRASIALKQHSARDFLENNEVCQDALFSQGTLTPRIVCKLFINLSDCPSLGNYRKINLLQRQSTDVACILEHAK